MFKNPGKTIKIVAIIYFWLTTAASIIAGIVLAIDSEEVIYLLMLLGGPAAAYITALFLVAFGELVENSTYLAQDQQEVRSYLEHICVSLRRPSHQAVSEPAKANHQPAPVETTPQETSRTETKKQESSGDENSNTQAGSVKPVAAKTPGMVCCPKCGCEQMSGRKMCWECGVKFQ